MLSKGGPIRLGTRGSALALAQSQQVADALAARAKREVVLVPVTTHGDTSGASLAQLGGTGVFAGALREALAAGEVDVVVHSLKDLPTAPADGLVIGAVPKRADPRDALVARDALTLETLPAGARVGTGSPRRRAQLLDARGDLEVADLRGNVDTRLARVTDAAASDRLDAVVLAAAGLARIDRSDVATQQLSIDSWPTAPGQGALAIEVRRGEERLVAALNHGPSRTIVEAERAVLAELEAGCAAPIAAHAIIDDGMLFLSARVYAPDGGSRLTASHALYLDDTPTPATDLAARVAAELVALGAREIAPL
ncbi:hydroxymethylbilane synthase [Galbitalea sp. SE-J8]|uniref:hydroxymethylbilane synthase n=1 Tax=Galbitalea sp. SE-J8 TaxID=3054952 RepID=UPI00259CF759|nr:hydroxymethylbilane synthase [Galbitalea sp. SE-J8]MDM4763320.1 hydroxymethylbilane synthase [Galbitalea sp. SE-J8]